MLRNTSVTSVPPDDSVVWRVLDFPRLLDLLDSSSLFLCRASALGDGHEGSMQPPLARLLSLIPLGMLPTAGTVTLSPGALEFGKLTRDWAFINSWYLADYESTSIWAFYGASNGVAIRSTVGRLRDAAGSIALPDQDFTGHSSEPTIGVVRYVDYDSELLPVNETHAPFFHKRREFDSEREMRILWTTLPLRNGELDQGSRSLWPGVRLTVDLGRLVEAVTLPAATPGWQIGLVERLLSRFGLAVPVRQSALDRSPTY